MLSLAAMSDVSCSSETSQPTQNTTEDDEMSDPEDRPSISVAAKLDFMIHNAENREIRSTKMAITESISMHVVLMLDKNSGQFNCWPIFECAPGTPSSTLYLWISCRTDGRDVYTMRCVSEMPVTNTIGVEISAQPVQSPYYAHVTALVIPPKREMIVHEEAEGKKNINFNGEDFVVSGGFLATWSSYFRDLFISNQQTSKDKPIYVNEPSLTPADFKSMLAAILPSSARITHLNYQAMLEISSLFEMPQLEFRVESFLLDHARLEMHELLRLAAQDYHLPRLLSMLKHRYMWDWNKLESEILSSDYYPSMSASLKNIINEMYVHARRDILTASRVEEERRIRIKASSSQLGQQLEPQGWLQIGQQLRPQLGPHLGQHLRPQLGPHLAAAAASQERDMHNDVRIVFSAPARPPRMPWEIPSIATIDEDVEREWMQVIVQFEAIEEERRIREGKPAAATPQLSFEENEFRLRLAAVQARKKREKAAADAVHPREAGSSRGEPAGGRTAAAAAAAAAANANKAGSSRRGPAGGCAAAAAAAAAAANANEAGSSRREPAKGPAKKQRMAADRAYPAAAAAAVGHPMFIMSPNLMEKYREMTASGSASAAPAAAAAAAARK